MFSRHLVVFVAACGLLACGPSVNPALQSSIDKRVLSFKQFSDNVYDAPQSTTPLPLAVGQWTRYKMMDKEGNPSLVTYKVVGEDAGAFWTETVRETYTEKQVTLLLVALGTGRTLDDVEVRAMKQKIDDQSPTEFPAAVLSLMKALWKPMVENMVVDWQGKQQDDARVPAGVFSKCYQAYSTVSLLGKSETTRSWSHPVVPLGGNVRSQSVDSTMSMVLLEFGLTGATSEIGI
ncbi:MAG: hypothetical protein ABI895_39390 [Deltaproteobacteria bacterium]